MFHLKPANLEVAVMFLVSPLLGALFAERFASESFQILGTSPAKAREQLLVLKFLRKRILTINACTETN